ncbi:MAG: DUF4159 domain-containing protein [Gemmatirosa sp.]
MTGSTRRRAPARHARPIALALVGVLAVAGALVTRADAASATAAATAPAAARIPRLTIARLQYDGGGDWYANPSSLPNLLTAIRERTTLRTERTEAKVRLTDDQLWDYPYLHLTGHGNVAMSDAEVARLREYILRGGFLHADDNYGLDESFRKVLARVFPDRPMVEVPLSHPIYHLVYEFPRGLPKVHEHDGKPPKGYGVFIGDRLAVYYTHESDLGNGWEDLGTYPNDPPEAHEQALRMGVNLFVYAVASRLP